MTGLTLRTLHMENRNSTRDLLYSRGVITSQPLVLRRPGLLLKNMTMRKQMSALTIVLTILSMSHLANASLENNRMEKLVEGIRHNRMDYFGGEESLKLEKIPVYGSMDTTGYYYVNMKLGTPGQLIETKLSTGTGLLAVDCSGEELGYNHGMSMREMIKSEMMNLTPFHLNHSRSAELLMCKNQSCLKMHGMGCNEQGLCTFEHKLLDGSIVKGEMFSDLIKFEDSDMDQTMRFNHIGCIKSATGNMKNLPGLLGLKFGLNTMPSLIEKMLNEKSLPEHIFSTCLSEYGGMLTLGGYDQHYHKLLSNNLEWLQLDNMSESGLTLMGHSMTSSHPTLFGEHKLNMQILLESGSRFSYLPSLIYERLTGMLNNMCTSLEGCTMHDNMCMTAHDLAVLQQRLPSLKLNLSTNEISWTPRSYMYHSGENKLCLGIKPSTDNMMLLGMSFFKNKQMVFDIKKNLIGVAEAQCPEIMHRRISSQLFEEEITLFNQEPLRSGKLNLDSRLYEFCDSGLMTYREICGLMENFERECESGSSRCTEISESLVEVVQKCDMPIFGYHNQELCEMVRYRIQKAQQMCSSMHLMQVHRGICRAIHFATEMMQERCSAHSFFNLHHQSCEDNQHYFVELMALRCSDEQFHNLNESFCGQICRFMNDEEQLCDSPHYFGNHVQACEYQGYFIKHQKEECREMMKLGDMMTSQHICHTLMTCQRAREEECSNGRRSRVCESRLSGMPHGLILNSMQNSMYGTHDMLEGNLFNRDEMKHERFNKEMFNDLYGIDLHRANDQSSLSEKTALVFNGRGRMLNVKRGLFVNNQNGHIQINGGHPRHMSDNLLDGEILNGEMREGHLDSHLFEGRQMMGEDTTYGKSLTEKLERLEKFSHLSNSMESTHLLESELLGEKRVASDLLHKEGLQKNLMSKDSLLNLHFAENLNSLYSLCESEMYFMRRYSQCQIVRLHAEKSLLKCEHLEMSDMCKNLRHKTENLKHQCLEQIYLSEHINSCQHILGLTSTIVAQECRLREFNKDLRQSLYCEDNMRIHMQAKLLLRCDENSLDEESCLEMGKLTVLEVERCHLPEYREQHLLGCGNLLTFVQRHQLKCLTDSTQMLEGHMMCKLIGEMTLRENQMCKDDKHYLLNAVRCDNIQHFSLQLWQQECALTRDVEKCSIVDEEILGKLERCDEPHYLLFQRPVCEMHRLRQNFMLQKCNSEEFQLTHHGFCKRHNKLREMIYNACQNGIYIRNHVKLCGDMNFSHVQYMQKQCYLPSFLNKHTEMCKHIQRELRTDLLQQCDTSLFYLTFKQMCDIHRELNMQGHLACLSNLGLLNLDDNICHLEKLSINEQTKRCEHENMNTRMCSDLNRLIKSTEHLEEEHISVHHSESNLGEEHKLLDTLPRIRGAMNSLYNMAAQEAL